MKISVKHLKKECKKVLSVIVPEERIKEAYDFFYKDISKSARVPGFRPGKVPRGVLETHYRKEAKEEVLRKLVSNTLGEAMRQEKIDPLSYPTIEKVEFDDNQLTYDAHVDVRPEIKVGSYKGVEVTKKEPAVKQEEVDDALERIRESRATFVPVEGRPAALDDYIVADFTCTVGAKELESRKNEWFHLKEGEALPGFSKHLAGAAIGEEKEVKTKFPENYHRKDCAGKDAVFKVTLREIKQKKAPEINDAWAKELGEYKSVLELRGAIREDLMERKKQEEEARLERELLDKILKTSQFDLPNSIIERRLDSLAEEGVRTLQMRGFKKEAALEKKDELRKNLRSEAERQVRVAFILDKIASLENISVEDTDVEKRYHELAAYYKKPLNEIKDYYKKEGLADNLILQILNEKVIKFLKDNAKIKGG